MLSELRPDLCFSRRYPSHEKDANWTCWHGCGRQLYVLGIISRTFFLTDSLNIQTYLEWEVCRYPKSQPYCANSRKSQSVPVLHSFLLWWNIRAKGSKGWKGLCLPAILAGKCRNQNQQFTSLPLCFLLVSYISQYPGYGNEAICVPFGSFHIN